jgi:hypothetical protein
MHSQPYYMNTTSDRRPLAMPDKELRVLSLYCGRVRGLSALMILERLIETINHDFAAEALRSL